MTIHIGFNQHKVEVFNNELFSLRTSFIKSNKPWMAEAGSIRVIWGERILFQVGSLMSSNKLKLISKRTRFQKVLSGGQPRTISNRLVRSGPGENSFRKGSFRRWTEKDVERFVPSVTPFIAQCKRFASIERTRLFLNEFSWTGPKWTRISPTVRTPVRSLELRKSQPFWFHITWVKYT